MKDFIKTTFVFAAGAAVGATVALLLSPETAKEAREKIIDLIEEAKNRTREYCETAVTKDDEPKKQEE
jgi:gas vesicle protein